MKRIIVIGGGFGGLSALAKLSKAGRGHDIMLIDRKQEFNFLPALPDIIGRSIAPEFLTCSLEPLSRKMQYKFIKDEVKFLDLKKRMLSTVSRTLSYDYLIIASGSQTNFYGNNLIECYGYTLGSVDDAKKILEMAASGIYDTFIISGGGYTGIELATQLRRFFHRRREGKKIIIIEKAPSLLGPLPEWMKQHVINNLNKLNIKVSVNCTMEKIDEHMVVLSTGEKFNKAMLIWTAGVRTADFIQNINVEKNPQGRVKVDAYLRIADNCFVIGDAAMFVYPNKPIRMAVQFAIAQGEVAAKNVLRSIRGKPLKRYKPKDLGYIIPIANNNSCGIIFGVKMRGLMPTLLHYTMCIYRTRGLRRKFGIVTDLIKQGGQ